jgi:hypothetical protein
MRSVTQTMPITHRLYLHGLRSSPQSMKARTMAHHGTTHQPALHWWCPQLPPSPRAAMALLMQGITDQPRESTAVVDSSLGGGLRQLGRSERPLQLGTERHTAR